MPAPTKGESEKDYVARFMASPEAQSDFPDEKQRLAVAYSMFRKRNNAASWPKRYACRFIEPGLVHYQDHGTVLVTSEALEKMASSFVGKPVINDMHVDDLTPDNFEQYADGYVTNVYKNDDGWWWADFIVTDEATQKNCESKGYSVSCSYDVKDFDSRGGTHNNVPYQQEVKDGFYTHLAVVPNPRYEGGRICLYNSTDGGSKMKLFKFWGSNKVKNEADVETATVTVEGKEYKVKDLIEKHKAKQAALKNFAGQLSPESIIEVDGDEISVKDLLNNAAEDEKEKKDLKKEEEMKNAEEEEKKKKDEEEKLKNAEEEKKKKDAEEKEKMDNSNFEKLRKASNMRGEPQPVVIKTQRDRVKEGKQLYGSEVAAGK